MPSIGGVIAAGLIKKDHGAREMSEFTLGMAIRSARVKRIRAADLERWGAGVMALESSLAQAQAQADVEVLRMKAVRYYRAINAVLDKCNMGESFLDGETIAEWNDAGVEFERAFHPTALPDRLKE